MNFKKIIRQSALIAVLGLASTGIVAGIIEQGKYEQTRREVQMIIDTDKNGIVTNKEWTPVYRFFNAKPNQYSFGTGYGLELSRKQLESYLENKTQELK
jgi:hypothetical protein